MARIMFPVRFAEQTTLFSKVKTKHTNDGLASVLIPFITEQAISFTDDQTAVTNADNFNDAFLGKEKNAEKQSAQRDLLFDPVFMNHRNCVQFLKMLYKTNPNRLGDWGITVDARGRINYPPDFGSRRQQVQTFIAKHLSFPAGTSPLQPFLDINGLDPADDAADTTAAVVAHDDFVQSNEDKETFREQRDNAIAPVIDHLHGIGTFLVNLYPSNPHKAGDWGYIIDASPKGSKERKVKLNEGQLKTVYDNVLESIMKNTGTTVLLVYPGAVDPADDPTGIPVPITLNPGQSAVAQRGFRIITIKNTSIIDKGEIHLTVSK